jgi:hypothetical protein
LDSFLQMRHYPHMMRRVVALIAVLCFALLPAITVAHATALAAGDAQVDHASHTMGAAHADHVDCETASSCDTGDSDGCAAACAALLGYMLPPIESVATSRALPSHFPSAETTAAGRIPGLSERPPKSRLL